MAYDLDAPEGERIVSAAIVDDHGDIIAPLVANGKLVGDPQDTFRMVTLSFLADGGDGYPFPPSHPDADGYDPVQAARIDRVDLAQEGIQTGTATFADDGTEQDALAEYLADQFPDSGSAFGQADVSRELDTRLQNLAFRSDTVFENGSPEIEVRLASGFNVVSGSSALEYGTLKQGSSATEFITLINTGVRDLVISSLTQTGANTGDFTIGSLTKTTIAPSESAVFTVTFAPKAAGTRTSSLRIANNDSDENPFILTLRGAGEAIPQPPVTSFAVQQGKKILKDEKSKSNFRRVTVGKSSKSMVFTIKNNGTATLKKLKIALTGKQADDFILVQQPDRSLAPGESTQFKVAYKPGKAGISRATLQISNKESGDNLFDIELNGKGVAPKIKVLLGKKNLKSKKSGLQFGDVAVGSKSKAAVLTIQNTGSAPLEKLKVSIGGKSAKEFQVVKKPSKSLAPGKSTKIKVIYLPSKVKAKASKANLLIGSNDANEKTFRLSLTGKGTR